MKKETKEQETNEQEIKKQKKMEGAQKKAGKKT